ncbi:MAG: UMP kinase [Candidatus Diapherotrites archaeon]|nr:UMP kinase [Candidatus Diapherotrites archaeon]
MFDESFFKIFNESQASEKQPTESSGDVEEIDFDRKPVVLSVGGSLIAQEKPNASFIGKFSEKIKELWTEGHRFAIVVGGGAICRNYIAAAKALGANNYSADALAIMVTRVNAMLLIQGLEKAYPQVLENVFASKKVLNAGMIPVYGGLLPGITTDCVAALLAEFLGGTFINLTNVDGVYSSDPRDNPRAKFYPEISYERLISLISVAESKPGQNLVMDLPSCLILKRSKIPAIILNGNDLDNFASAVRGLPFKGTKVCEKA